MAVIGIDLGTTNSLAAYWKAGAPQLIPNSRGGYLTPSVVSYVEEENGVVVGELAKERLTAHKEDTRASFKRFMGTEKEFRMGGKTYHAMELSAMVLGKIKKEAEEFLGEQIEEAVVTVPAYFNDKQRSDTKKAAQLAGLPVKRLINEPSAAALAYRLQYGGDDKSLLVFDFGGGTLDLSLVECFDDVVEIIGVAGDNYLGGDDIDLCIARWFCTQNHMDFNELDGEKQEILRRKCEKAKQEISTKQQIVIRVGAETAELTEEQLFEICLPLFSRIRKLFLRILKDCSYHISDIDDLIMVGGSSKLSIVKRFLTELLGKEPVVLLDTECAVALGAGVYAGIRERKEDIRDMMLTDVCPFTLGIACYNSLEDKDAHLLPVIERNSTLPARKYRQLTTLMDYQTNMRIKIYQGEEYRAEDNVYLGELEIELLPKKAREAKVDICFTYDLNGILQVEVINEQGQKKNILLSNRDLTEEEISGYLAQMQQMISPDTKQEQIRILKEKAMRYYGQSTGKLREQIAALFGWFEEETNSGRKYRQERAVRVMEQQLAFLEQQEEEMDLFLFDGKLKWEAAELEEPQETEEQSEERIQ